MCSSWSFWTSQRATWIVEGRKEDFFNQPSLTGPHACLLHCLLIFQSHLNANEGPRGHSIHKRDAPLSNASSLPTAPLKMLPVEGDLVSVACRVTLQSTDRNLESFWPTIAGGSAAGGQHGRGGNLSLTRKSKHGAKMEHRRPGPYLSAFFDVSTLSICRQKSHFKSVFEFWLGKGAERKRIRNCNESGLVVVIEIYSSRLQILICSKKTSLVQRRHRPLPNEVGGGRLSQSIAGIFPLFSFHLTKSPRERPPPRAASAVSAPSFVRSKIGKAWKRRREQNTDRDGSMDGIQFLHLAFLGCRLFGSFDLVA